MLKGTIKPLLAATLLAVAPFSAFAADYTIAQRLILMKTMKTMMVLSFLKITLRLLQTAQ